VNGIARDGGLERGLESGALGLGCGLEEHDAVAAGGQDTCNYQQERSPWVACHPCRTSRKDSQLGDDLPCLISILPGKPVRLVGSANRQRKFPLAGYQ